VSRLRTAFDDSDDLLKVGFGAIVALAAGALGPWFVTDAGDFLGTDGGYYGTYVLAVAVIIGIALWSWSQVPGREKLIGVAIGAGAALVLMVVEIIDANEAAGLGIGWGLILGIAASVVLLGVTWRLAVLNPA
jgi:peptidoglycan/LPS O-acetylase OafA/YrhL